MAEAAAAATINSPPFTASAKLPPEALASISTSSTSEDAASVKKGNSVLSPKPISLPTIASPTVRGVRNPLIKHCHLVRILCVLEACLLLVAGLAVITEIGDLVPSGLFLLFCLSVIIYGVTLTQIWLRRVDRLTFVPTHDISQTKSLLSSSAIFFAFIICVLVCSVVVTVSWSLYHLLLDANFEKTPARHHWRGLAIVLAVALICFTIIGVGCVLLVAIKRAQSAFKQLLVTSRGVGDFYAEQSPSDVTRIDVSESRYDEIFDELAGQFTAKSAA